MPIVNLIFEIHGLVHKVNLPLLLSSRECDHKLSTLISFKGTNNKESDNIHEHSDHVHY